LVHSSNGGKLHAQLIALSLYFETYHDGDVKGHKNGREAKIS